MKLPFTTAVWIELGAVVTIPVAAWYLHPTQSSHWALGELVLALSVLLLVQTLFRDLWLLRAARRARPEPRQRVRCMCVESVVGVAGILGGGGILVAGVLPHLEVGRLGLAVSLLSTTAFGFLSKDYVLDLSPLGIRRAPDHVHLLVGWWP